jgi:16S rRNA (cytidine1402-2'-O)-methyltransferase
VGTLCVVGVPAAAQDDLTARALRLLGEVTAVAAGDVQGAQRFLGQWAIHIPVMDVADRAVCLEALARGDVALLSPGEQASPTGPAIELICAAAARGFAVRAVPGPSLPITALALSGLPADSFVYLGELPRDPGERRDLLTSVARELRTLVALESSGRVRDAVADLDGLLGERPLVISWITDQGYQTLWRRAVREALEHLPALPQGFCALVIGGAREVGLWSSERLKGEVWARQSRGLGAKEISQELAAESGWPAREVYRLAVERAPAPENR